jgi:hypothetical protein
MPRAATFALVALSSLLLPVRGVGQVSAMPKAEDGYTTTKTDDGENAPPNYEGRSDDATQTAIGNTDATRGKRYFVHVKLANKVKTCPKADGSAEGDGELSAGFDYTDSTTGASEHDDMHAIAKYKGKVGENAWLEGPITADIDFTLTKSGTSGRGGGAAPPSMTASQHVTVTFVVLPGGDIPKFDAFAGGDANLPGLSEAYGAAAPLGFFAGYHYSVAETDNKNATVGVTFDESSGTYTVTPNSAPFRMGTMHSTSCVRDKCTSHDQPYGIQGLFGDMSGKIEDRNHVQGSKTVVTPNVGNSRHGQQVYTLRWDLSRKGTTQ